ncbi:ABC transporter transmembrane domain-containing protein, partial [Oleiphilus sp. HI0132]
GILWQQYRFEFALIVLISVIAYVWFSKTTTDWRTQFIREANQADSKSNTRAIDSLLNYETVKYFTNEQYEADLYDKELEKWEQAKRKNRLTLFALNGGQALIISSSLTAMLVLAAHEVSTGRMTLGDFVLVNAFMMQIFLPLNFL